MFEFRKNNEEFNGGLYGRIQIGTKGYPVWSFAQGYFEEETFDPDMGDLRQFSCPEDEDNGWVIPFSKEDEEEWKSMGGRIFRNWNGRISFWFPVKVD